MLSSHLRNLVTMDAFQETSHEYYICICCFSEAIQMPNNCDLLSLFRLGTLASFYSEFILKILYFCKFCGTLQRRISPSQSLYMLIEIRNTKGAVIQRSLGQDLNQRSKSLRDPKP
jgi:hypothetical protein